jgi:lipopolysaccharide export system permease protein
MEKIENGKMISKLMSERIIWDSTKTKWKVENYFIRSIDGMKESIKSGHQIDTALAFKPDEFNRRTSFIETMDSFELKKYIEEETLRGSEEIPLFQVELYRRTAFPFATFILTLIGVSLSSKKVRGGIGMQIGIGIILSFTYIMFMQISQTFATNGSMSPLLAVWIPNIFFLTIGVYLAKKAMQ